MKLNHHLKIHPTDKSVGFLLTKTRKFVYTGVFIPEKETDDFYVIIDKFGDEIVLNKSSIEIIKKFKEVEDR